MKGIQVTVKLNDGGTLSLAQSTTNEGGYVIGWVRPCKPPNTHTIAVTEKELLDLPTLIAKIGTIL